MTIDLQFNAAYLSPSSSSAKRFQVDYILLLFNNTQYGYWAIIMQVIIKFKEFLNSRDDDPCCWGQKTESGFLLQFVDRHHVIHHYKNYWRQEI